MLRRACLIVLSLVAAAPVSAVSRRVPSQYPTIQSGINAAAAGDTVLVADGTYTGAGNRDVDFLGKSIVVRSEHGAASTIVNCQGSAIAAHRGFFFRSGETNAAVLEGFTIENGYVGGPMNGGGIECEFSSPTIRACVVRDCTVAEFGSDGGGICCRTSNARIEDCTILRNFASYGGGIACRGELPVTIMRCTVTGNVANYGGGIDSGALGAPLIVDCMISGNEAAGGIGGNPAGGGLLLAGGAVARNCVVTGNRAGRGGGIFCQSTTTTIDGCTVVANSAADGDGGGVFAFDGASIIRNTILWDNCAAAVGDDINAGPGGSISYGCCIVDPSGVAANGGVLHDLGNNLAADPLLCAPASCTEAPTSAGTFSVGRMSPAFPDLNPCGVWIGALRVGCPAADVAENPMGRGAADLEVAPNPTMDRVSCRFDVARAGRVRLTLIDAAGRSVRTLLDADQPVGPQSMALSLRGSDRRSLPSGTYFLRIEGPGGGAVRPICLIR